MDKKNGKLIVIPLLFFILYLVVVYRYHYHNNIVDKLVYICLIVYYSILDIRYGLVACFFSMIYLNTAPAHHSYSIPETFDIMNIFKTSYMSIYDEEPELILDDSQYINGSTGNRIPKIIWLYWHDNIEDAPDIVKYCVNIVKKLNKDYNINILNRYNLHKYVKDKRVLKHLNNPRLQEMHKSDLLRMYLINTYGGIYMDSSIVLFESFDWIYKMPNYDLIMYKANIHTTDNTKPVLENWFIAAKPQNILIKETLTMLLDIFDDNMVAQFKILKNDRTVNYQKFKDHDIYHLTYFCLIYVQHKFNITNNNYYIDCNPTIFPFNVLYGNQHTLDKLYNAPITEKTFKIYKSKHMLKLASYNRKYIAQRRLQPKPDSFMDRLNNSILLVN